MTYKILVHVSRASTEHRSCMTYWIVAAATAFLARASDLSAVINAAGNSWRRVARRPVICDRLGAAPSSFCWRSRSSRRVLHSHVNLLVDDDDNDDCGAGGVDSKRSTSASVNV